MAAISYDSQEVLRTFAESNGIEYPLLADEGSRVITELGVLDLDLVAHHEAFGVHTTEHQQGVAYPAVFVLDADGRVEQKRVQENYRAREGAQQLVDAVLGGEELRPAETATQVAAPRVRVSAQTDSPSYIRWEKSRLHVLLEVEEGWHVYGRPTPTGYTPLKVEIEPEEGLVVGEPAYPPTRPFRVEGLDEDFNVCEGRLHVVLPFALNVAPKTGERTLRVGVSWQACSNSECLMPELRVLEISLQEAPPV